jgi:MFS family permease
MAARPGLLGRYVGSAHAMFGLGGALGPFLGVWVWNHLGSQVWVWCGLAGALGVVLAYFGMSNRAGPDPVQDPVIDLAAAPGESS